MALGSMPSRIRNLQRELLEPSQDVGDGFGRDPNADSMNSIGAAPPGGMGVDFDPGSHRVHFNSGEGMGQIVPVRTSSQLRPPLLGSVPPPAFTAREMQSELSKPLGGAAEKPGRVALNKERRPFPFPAAEQGPEPRAALDPIAAKAAEAVASAVGRGMQVIGAGARKLAAPKADYRNSGDPVGEEYAPPEATPATSLALPEYGEEPNMEGAAGIESAEQMRAGPHSGERGKPLNERIENNQLQDLPPDSRRALEAEFNRLWAADQTELETTDGQTEVVGGALRSTYTREHEGGEYPDFDSFLRDVVQPGEDPIVSVNRVLANIRKRDAGVDGAGRKRAGYTTPVTPVAPPSADEAEKQSRAAKPFVPGASRLPRGVTRPNAFSADQSGGENGQGQNRIRVGMAAHMNAHELAGDQEHDLERNGEGFPTTMDKWAEMLRKKNNPDDERAYVLMFAQQNGFDFTGVPEEDQYNAAKRMTAETLFRYGDAEQKKWAKGWGKLKGDRWHISMKRDDKGNRSPVATQPMRTAAWDPTTGTFVESATEFARGQTQRLRDISDTREAVKRSPTNFMDENDFIQQMGEDNWNSLTPAQKAKFLGEAARGMEVHRNNVNSARNREIAANTPRARGWYQEEMGKASTPLDMFRVAQKYGDLDAMDRIGQIISGDQAAAAAAAGAKQGDPGPAQQMKEVADVRQQAIEAVANGGSAQGGIAVLDPDNRDPRGTHRNLAQGVVSTWRRSGQLDSMTPMAIVNHQGLRDYLKDVAPSGAVLKGDKDGWLSKGNDSLSAEFAASVIADLGLRDTPEMRAALDQWWRSQPSVNAPLPPAAAPAPAAAQTPAAQAATTQPGPPPLYPSQGYVPNGTGDIVGDLWNFFTR